MQTLPSPTFPGLTPFDSVPVLFHHHLPPNPIVLGSGMAVGVGRLFGHLVARLPFLPSCVVTFMGIGLYLLCDGHCIPVGWTLGITFPGCLIVRPVPSPHSHNCILLPSAVAFSALAAWIMNPPPPLQFYWAPTPTLTRQLPPNCLQALAAPAAHVLVLGERGRLAVGQGHTPPHPCTFTPAPTPSPMTLPIALLPLPTWV